MKTRIIFWTVIVLVLVASLFLLNSSKRSTKGTKPIVQTFTSATVAKTTGVHISSPTNSQKKPSIKTRFLDFTSDEQSAFAVNFEKRYKPAIQKWCNAFNGHVPISPETVTQENFVERIGRNDSYHEYIFVANGVTLGIEDKNGDAQVDYLNDPRQTQKLTTTPTRAEAPIATSPITREQLINMLAAAGGTHFPASEIHLTPSGFSGGLNGGVMVHVGGDPENAASWEYDMIFGADGKLAYYLKGI